MKKPNVAPKVAIIDYGAGNVRSLGNMLTFLDVPYDITNDREKIKNADRIIFPEAYSFSHNFL